MEEINFEKVFEDLKTIRSNVVPKSQYEEAQLEIERLKSLLQAEKGEIKNDQTSEDQKPIGEEIIDNEISKKKE